MSKKIQFYKCTKCDHVTERLVEDNITITACEECSEEAKRMLCAPRCFGNTTGGSPSSNYSKPR